MGLNFGDFLKFPYQVLQFYVFYRPTVRNWIICNRPYINVYSLLLREYAFFISFIQNRYILYETYTDILQYEHELFFLPTVMLSSYVYNCKRTLRNVFYTMCVIYLQHTARIMYSKLSLRWGEREKTQTKEVCLKSPGYSWCTDPEPKKPGLLCFRRKPAGRCN